MRNLDWMKRKIEYLTMHSYCVRCTFPWFNFNYTCMCAIWIWIFGFIGTRIGRGPVSNHNLYVQTHTQTHTTNFTRNTKNASLIKMANHSIDRNIIAFSEFNLFSIVHIWITHSLFFSHSLLSLCKNCLPSFPSTPFFPFAPEIQFKHEHYFTNAASTTTKSNTQCNILHSF